ncbi:MAG: hypothetical protein L6R42_000296 [Xanthoria sp. 1 TBL-2021]|nr:MAG: hypothetical protein L6R42_000296 [Xanthoria sp. 1 TBL-2021]
MFFDGDLQAGISQALRDSQPVACFVLDDGEQSKLWEESFLIQHEIVGLLSEKAFALRIRAGSQEAGYLAAYFPVSNFPTMVIIYNGQLITHLQAGVEYDAFRNAIFGALSQDQQESQSDFPSRSRDSTSPSSLPESSASPQQETTTSPAVASTDPQQESRTLTPGSSSLQQVMEDRRKRLDADKAAKDAAEKEQRKSIAQARREAASASNSKPGDPVSNQSLYAQQQRKRKLEAKAERERILREIENDKAARKEKEAQRRALARAETADADKETEPTDAKPPQHWAASGQQCSLQIRLFNGLTIREKFAPQETLSKNVRTWIAEQRTDGDTPFTLKQIVAPSPSRTITISEEEQSLQSLGLLPSATLVMVPIQGYTNAYTSNEGIVGKAVSMGYNAASAGGNMVAGALGAVLGFGRATTESEQVSTPDDSSAASGPARASESTRFRTLRPREDTDHQLYNGNQLNFEPRPKDDDEDER